MPQLSLDPNEPSGTSFTIDYRSDPLKPERPGVFTLVIKDGRSNVLLSQAARIPNGVTHELMKELLGACWEAWLFGTLADVKRTLRSTLVVWKTYAALPPRTE